MKKLISLLLIMVIMVLPVQVLANDEDGDGIDEGLVEQWTVLYGYGTVDCFDHDSMVAFAKGCIKEGLVTIDEIRDPDAEPYEVEIDPTIPSRAVKKWIDEMVDAFAHPFDPKMYNHATLVALLSNLISEGILHVEELYDAPVVASGNYARLELISKDTKKLRGSSKYAIYVDGHYYSTTYAYDDMEEIYTSSLLVDGKSVYDFGEDLFPRGLAYIGNTVYVAKADGIYEYSEGNLKLVAEFGGKYGYIYGITSNGKDLYVYTGEDSTMDPIVGGFDASFYKIGANGAVTPIKGSVPYFDYDKCTLSASADGLSLTYAPKSYNGVMVVKTKDGSRYTQRLKDSTEYANGYCVDNVIYYGNCLIANVNGSLVYYDEKNQRKLLLGDMKGNRDQEYMHAPRRGDLPIQTGSGDKVNIGTVISWDVGSDGCIYGYTWVGKKYGEDLYEYFRLTIPESVKSVNTYRKLEK